MTNLTPLSHSQERLWLLETIERPGPAYHMQIAATLKGALDVEALERALLEIVRRHDILRTTFSEVDGRPVQIVHPLDARCRLEVTEFKSAAPREAIEEWKTTTLWTPFNLAEAPPIRLGLARLSPSEHMLVVAMHHILTDGWSMAIFIRELEVLYEAFVLQHPSPLSPLRIQYVDYSAWQAERLSAGELDDQIEYWRRTLEDAVPVLNLPNDRPRPDAQHFRGGAVQHRWPAEIVTELAELAKRHSATLSMTMLAVLQALLCRYTGQDDITVSMPSAGRSEIDTERMIGFFVNTLPIRTDFRGNPSFSAILKSVRKTFLEAYAHQEVPYEVIVPFFQPLRDRSRPVIQVLFGYHTEPRANLRLFNLEVTGETVRNPSAKLDLSLDLFPLQDGGLLAEITYASDLFDQETIDRFVAHYRNLCRSVSADPDRGFREASFVGADQCMHLIGEWDEVLGKMPQRAQARLRECITTSVHAQQPYRVLLLDANSELVPVGVPGQLCVAGLQFSGSDGAVRSESVVPSPSGEGPLLRTSILGRWRGDRSFEYLGCTDDCIVVNGRTVNPFEVESVILANTEVLDASVHVVEKSDEETILIAYMVPTGDAAPIDKIRRFLRSRLPGFMVPREFHWVDRLPDGNAFDTDLVPQQVKSGAESTSARPTDYQNVLALLQSAVAELLDVENVKPNDDFFELGGSSLVGMRLLAQIHEKTGILLPLHVLFESPTLEKLAQHIVAEEPALS